ncbi:Alpha/Beta hydrolase protein [Xylariaceae sp. FL0662B]|nr:Alpha/Beta hydrolase protein [Xylariaceae sp. FL0662B]
MTSVTSPYLPRPPSLTSLWKSAGQMLRSLKRILDFWCKPTLDALWYGRHLPWSLRWRLLAFQPVWTLSNVIVAIPYFFRPPFKVEYIPVAPDRSVRALVFKGGLPELNAPFCTHVANRTGAVVVSITYRFAPIHPFPAAIDDVDAAISWLRANAADKFGADPNLMTISGSSAGATCALAATQQPACHGRSSTAFKAAVTFYAPVDVRPFPGDKPRPAKFPKRDPLWFMQRLYHSYATLAKRSDWDSPRMNPTLAKVETLPPRMLFVVAAIDILVKEQLDFIERVTVEDEAAGRKDKRIDTMYVEDGFHGYLEREFPYGPQSPLTRFQK